MKKPAVKPNGYGIWLWAIILAHFVLGAVYWMNTPYGVAPDEEYHGRYVEQLAENHALPVFSPDDRENYEAHQPPLYYLLGAPFRLAAGATRVRLLSLILGGLSILTVYAAAKSIMPNRQPTAVACAGFVGLMPMHLALSSAVGNDILAELVFGVALLLMTRLLSNETNRSYGPHVLLGVVLGLGLLTKTTCVLLFPAAVLVYVLQWRRRELDAPGVLSRLALMLAASLAVGGWWLVRNHTLYGDPLALSVFNQAFSHTAKPEYFLVERGLPLWQYVGLVAAWTFASFWGVFGHMQAFMPAWIYVALAGVTIVTVARSGRGLLSAIPREILVVLGTVLALVLASFVRFNLDYFQAQGRYLYPAIIPIALVFVLGTERLLRGNLHLAVTVINGGMLLLSIAALGALSSIQSMI